MCLQVSTCLPFCFFHPPKPNRYYPHKNTCDTCHYKSKPKKLKEKKHEERKERDQWSKFEEDDSRETSDLILDAETQVKPFLCTVMATLASGSTVPIKLHSTHKPKPPSPFLRKKLNLKPYSRTTITSKPKTLAVLASSGGEFLDAVHNLFLGVGVGLPCTVMECRDIIYRSTLPKPSGLTLTVPGAALALGTLSYLWATPGVAPGFFDMFFPTFVERLFRPTFKKVSASDDWFCCFCWIIVVVS